MSGRPRVLVAVVLTWLLAGCAAPSGRPLLVSTLEDVHRFQDYTWEMPIRTDAAGNAIPLQPADRNWTRPPYTERLLDGQGSDMTIAITDKGTWLASTFEHVMRSEDQGRTWKRVHDHSSVIGDHEDKVYSFGAYLRFDGATKRTWVSHLNANNVERSVLGPVQHPITRCPSLHYSDDDGLTWHASRLASFPATCGHPYGSVLQQRVLTGPPTPGTIMPTALQSFAQVLYICGTTETLGARCDVSFDGGDTVAYAKYINESPDLACEVLNIGQPATTSAGAVILPLGAVQAPMDNHVTGTGCAAYTSPTVAVSQDNGFTWELKAFPGHVPQSAPYSAVATTPDGTAYLAFRSQHNISLLRSRDLFTTWDGPFRISGPNLTLVSHAAIATGDDGRVVVSWLGTRTPQDTGAEPEWAYGGTVWHLFVTRSDDAGADSPTFLTHQVTPREDPLQIGCLRPPFRTSDHFSGTTLWAGYECPNLLNFMTTALAPEGRLLIAMADGCDPRNDCTADLLSGFQARELRPALAVQQLGPSLLRDRPDLTPLDSEHPRPNPRTCCT